MPIPIQVYQQAKKFEQEGYSASEILQGLEQSKYADISTQIKQFREEGYSDDMIYQGFNKSPVTPTSGIDLARETLSTPLQNVKEFYSPAIDKVRDITIPEPVKNVANRIWKAPQEMTETGVEVVTGALSYIPAKTAGSIVGAFDIEKGKEVEEAISNFINDLYKPQNEYVKQNMDGIGQVLDYMLKPAQKGGEIVSGELKRMMPVDISGASKNTADWLGYITQFGLELAEFKAIGGIKEGLTPKEKANIIINKIQKGEAPPISTIKETPLPPEELKAKVEPPPEMEQIKPQTPTPKPQIEVKAEESKLPEPQVGEGKVDISPPPSTEVVEGIPEKVSPLKIKEAWDYTIEDTGIGTHRMQDKTGKGVARTEKNIKGKNVRVWNSAQADEVIKKGGIPIDAQTQRQLTPKEPLTVEQGKVLHDNEVVTPKETTNILSKASNKGVLKEQKAYLLSEIDKVIEKAPENIDIKYKTRKVVTEEGYGSKIEDTNYVDLENTPYIEIEVPNDGTFKIPNSKAELIKFKDKVKSQFPTKTTEERKYYTEPSATQTKNKITPLENAWTIKVSPEEIWHTNGHLILKGEPSIKFKSINAERGGAFGSGKQARKKINDVIPKDAKEKIVDVDYFITDPTIEGIGKEPFGKGSAENRYVRLTGEKGNIATLNQELYKYALKHYPDAEFYMKDNKTGIVIKNKGEIVGVIMPIRGDVGFPEHLKTDKSTEIEVEVNAHRNINGHWTKVPAKGKEALEGYQEILDYLNKPYEEATKQLPAQLQTELKQYYNESRKGGLSKEKAKKDALSKLKDDIEIQREEVLKQIDEVKVKQPEPVVEKPLPTSLEPLPIEGKVEPPMEVPKIEAKVEGKIEAGSLAYGQKLPKYAGNINLERIDSPYAVKKTILDIADQYKGKIEEARRGKISLEETRKLADELGTTEKDLLKRRKGKAFNAEEALAARDILNASATRLRQVQEEAVKLGTDEALTIFKITLEKHAAIQSEVAGMTAEAGRALSSFRIKSKAMQQVKNYKAMLDALGGRDLTEDILKKFAQIDPSDITATNKFIRQVSKAKTTDMVYEAWINAILSGPQTHVVNTTSNLLTFLSKPTESVIGASLEAGKQIITGKPRERFFGESRAEVVGGLQGIKEGVRAAIKTYTTEMPSDVMGKIETTKYQAIPSKTITVKGKEYEIGGKQVRIPSRLLLAADDFFKAVIYRAELNSQAYRNASTEGLRGKARLERMAELIDNPTDIMMKHAHEEAQYRTFTKPLGKIGNQLLALRNHTPALRYVIPFLRTPTNIAKFGLERTPLNFIRLAYKRGKGEIKGAEFADELAKPILGSIIGAAVVILTKEGMVTGGGSKDKTDKETLYRGGWQPYSLKIGDTYYGYNRLEPVGSIFGMAADFSELTTNKDRDEMASKIALSISKNLTSKTFMKGLSNALDAISDPDRYGEQWVNQFAGSLIPSISANIARATDEKLRKTETPVETIKSRIPIISESLLPKRDLWGREILKTGTTITRLVSPIAISVESKDKLDKEMIRLMDKGDFKIGMPNKKIKGVELSDREYDRYVKKAGEGAKTILDKMVNRKTWNTLPDERKARLIKTIIEQQRIIAKTGLFLNRNKKKTIETIIKNRQLMKTP